MKRRYAYVAAGIIVLSAIALVVSLQFAPYPVVGFSTVREGWQSSDAWLLDRNGEPLSRLRVDHNQRRGDWLQGSEVSPALVSAILASEDKRFRLHHGIDWLAMLSAIRQTVAGSHRGASTVTMQLAAYLHPELDAGGRRGWLDKWRQMRQAAAMERTWTKDQILEAWLNLTPFRGEIEGVDAAARALLGVSAGALDRSQSALLAALVRAPNASAQRVVRRACRLLNGDERECALARISASGGFAAARSIMPIDGEAPHLARKLLVHAGERLATTLDARVQRYANETLQRHLRELAGSNVEDGALLVLDNATGEVLAWVGSSGELSAAHQVDGVTAQRQAGSTLKPFLYATAIERRLLTAASILEDTPLALSMAAGLYVPQDYDDDFKGRISLRTALGSSLNIPAVRTLKLLGYPAFYQQLKRLGFETLTRDADHYGYALALGGADVSLLQLSNAYRTLANGGRASAVRAVAAAEADAMVVQAIDADAAFIITDILADPAARALTFGASSPLTTRYFASVKTGTSKDMRDNWAVGYTSRYTVGVWVGNFSGAPMHDVSGVTGAAPVWREVMDFLHERELPARPLPPSGVVAQRITYSPQLEPRRDEWFLAGTETAKVVAIDTALTPSRIVSPSSGATYAIDPDIPRDRQRIVLRAQGARRGMHFVVDGGPRVAADAPFLLLPTPGRHQIALNDARGVELDRVTFQVRGMRRLSRPNLSAATRVGLVP